MIEMQLQDMFFNTDDEMPPLIAQLVTISKYMLQNMSKSQKAHKQKTVANQIYDAKKLEATLEAERNRQEKYFESSRSQIEQMLREKLLPEPKSDEEFVTQCCLAFFLVSFHSVTKQIERISADPDLSCKIIAKLQLLLGFLDFSDIQAKRKQKWEKLAKKVFFACQNMHPLDRDDLDQEENENLFEEFEGKYYLMSIHSNIADKLQDLQQKLLSATLGQQITKLFRSNVKSYFYQETLLTKLNKKMKRLEIDPFATEDMIQPGSGRQLAFMIDLDLQFVLVPCNWTNTIIQKRMTRVLDVLHQINTTKIVAALNKSSMEHKDRIILEAFRFNNNVDRKISNCVTDYDMHFSSVLNNLINQYRKTTPCDHEKELFTKHKAYLKIQNNANF